jgi:hypothetical protein
MAIANDTAIDIAFASTSPSTTSFTVGTESNRYLVVAVLSLNTQADDISSVTYNGVSMTKLIFQANGISETQTLFGLSNPDSGAHNIVVTFSCPYIIGAAASYANVLQSGQPNNTAHGEQPSNVTSLNAAITTSVNNCRLFMLSRAQTAQSAGTDTTQLAGGASPTVGYWDSGNTVFSAGSNALNVTFSASSIFWTIIALAPSLDSSSKFALLGVG